jgi:hypothetical protein
MLWYFTHFIINYIQPYSLSISKKEEIDELETFIRNLGYNMENIDMKHILYICFFYIFIDIDNNINNTNYCLYNFNNLIKTHLKNLVLLSIDVSNDKIMNVIIPIEWTNNNTFLIYIKHVLFNNEDNIYYDFIVKIVSMYKTSFSTLLQIYFEKLFSNDGIVIFNFHYEINNKNDDIESAYYGLLFLQNIYKKNEIIII